MATHTRRNCAQKYYLNTPTIYLRRSCRRLIEGVTCSANGAQVFRISSEVDHLQFCRTIVWFQRVKSCVPGSNCTAPEPRIDHHGLSYKTPAIQGLWIFPHSNINAYDLSYFIYKLIYLLEHFSSRRTKAF